MTHKLYTSLADWWPLLSSPEEYAEEAETYANLLLSHGSPPAKTLLELGSGGGNNASHLKRRFDITLADLSPGMLAVSRKLNPECEHIEGDMRTLRLGRRFDRVFIQDAIAYMTSAGDLKAAIETAFIHCRPGGAALFAPDFIRETFRASTSHGGHDGPRRGLRYLEWTWDPDPEDTTYTVDLAYLLRFEDGTARVEHDRHIAGLFSRAEWMRILVAAGFEPLAVPFEYPLAEADVSELFLGVRAAG